MKVPNRLWIGVNEQRDICWIKKLCLVVGKVKELFLVGEKLINLNIRFIFEVLIYIDKTLFQFFCKKILILYMYLLNFMFKIILLF